MSEQEDAVFGVVQLQVPLNRQTGPPAPVALLALVEREARRRGLTQTAQHSRL